MSWGAACDVPKRFSSSRAMASSLLEGAAAGDWSVHLTGASVDIECTVVIARCKRSGTRRQRISCSTAEGAFVYAPLVLPSSLSFACVAKCKHFGHRDQIFDLSTVVAREHLTFEARFEGGARL